jgi:hypothetical protein
MRKGIAHTQNGNSALEGSAGPPPAPNSSADQGVAGLGPDRFATAAAAAGPGEEREQGGEKRDGER